jgi:hypothetical protein
MEQVTSDDTHITLELEEEDGDGEEFSIDMSTKEPYSEGGLLKDGICPRGTETGWCAGSDDETLSETTKGEFIVSDKAENEAGKIDMASIQQKLASLQQLRRQGQARVRSPGVAAPSLLTLDVLRPQ